MTQEASRDQVEVIAFLMRPDAYAGAVDRVERIDTHGALILLAGDRAYKLKRAVKLPYFDFSTIEKRRRVCERELAINRRTAPGLYLHVLPIKRGADGLLAFGGDGDILDWVVVMKRFPDEALLDRLCVSGQLDPALMPPLARAIRQFHTEAEERRNAPWLAVLARIIDTLEETLLGEDAAPLALSAVPYLNRLRGELAHRETLLLQRQRQGHVRRCHGDLHLKNIVLLDGQPVLFDAIEFDENLASIDVLCDLAFLLMDLWHRGRKAEANAVLNVYCERDGVGEGLAVLPLFLSLRAAIRAMVGVHALPLAAESERGAAESGIRAYLALAEELLSPPPPRLICIGGLSGTGKTTVSGRLAPFVGACPGAIHLRSDVERKLMFGVEPTARLEPSAYADEVSQEVHRRLHARALPILRAGHCVIIDAVFRDAPKRDAARELARDAGAPFLGIWLEAGADQMIARVEQRRNDASDADREVVSRQLRSGVARPDGWLSVDAGGDVDETLARVLALL
jgi:uncharacterized protein